MNYNIHRSAYSLSEQTSEAYETVRETVKDFIHAEKAEEIIFTSGTTESINLVADSFGQRFIKKDDEIIITEMEHHSNIIPWQRLCERKNARLRIISMSDEGTLDLDKLDDLITEKTKIISVTYVSNVLGTINPMKEIITIAHEHNIPVLIDGAQAVQRIPVDVQELDCDFLAFSGHKIYAETGIGVLYAKEKWLQQMPPYQTGGGMVSSVSFDKTEFAEPPFKFEAGTSNISAVLSLGHAIKYLNTIGIKNIQRHEAYLTNYAYKALSDLEGVTIYGNAHEKIGAISFNIEGVNHYDATIILDKLGIALRSGLHCAEPIMKHFHIPGCIRASFAIYNSIEEIDLLVNGIGKVKEMFKEK
jgi:cysteine desulfurase/selenocysteine lyase